ncbi:hypothetical protein [Dongshaea marina]|uniref:hypothetical protein n=1 Tax=Dongshaea marina TaxID=2047966 RepID=UPI000D3E9AC9|nr:hypothetical protein [Dongshaea marina]
MNEMELLSAEQMDACPEAWNDSEKALLPPQLIDWRDKLCLRFSGTLKNEQLLYIGEPARVVIRFEPELVAVYTSNFRKDESHNIHLQLELQGGVSVAEGELQQLQLLVKQALDSRGRHYLRCSGCGQTLPKEYLERLEDAAVCRRCVDKRYQQI